MFDGLKTQMSFGICACLIPLMYRQYRTAPSLIQRWETSQENGISSAAKFVHYYYLLNNYMMILKYLS